VIASHLHRFVFVKTRKTAGTSIEIALSRHCGPDDVITPISPEDEVLRQQAGGRGPQHHDTEPSCFNHMRARRVIRVLGRPTWDDYFTFAVERNPWDVVASSYRYSTRRPGFRLSFAEYVRAPRVDRLAANRLVYTIGDEVVVDRVYRYEDLSGAMRDVGERLGLDLALPHAKHSTGPHYRELYAPADVEVVRERFAWTIEHLGYEF
jgi:hypothetical protein